MTRALCFATARLAHPHHQSMIDCLPQPRVAPAVEEPLHRRKRRKLLGQLAPLAAGRQDVKYGVDHRTQFRGPWPPQSLRRRQQSFDQLPFPIADIAYIAQIITAILRSSGFGPHLVSPVYLANQTDTQVTEITQFILGQLLKTRDNFTSPASLCQHLGGASRNNEQL